MMGAGFLWVFLVFRDKNEKLLLHACSHKSFACEVSKTNKDIIWKFICIRGKSVLGGGAAVINQVCYAEFVKF